MREQPQKSSPSSFMHRAGSFNGCPPGVFVCSGNIRRHFRIACLWRSGDDYRQNLYLWLRVMACKIRSNPAAATHIDQHFAAL
jgi:hypothetical protein